MGFLDHSTNNIIIDAVLTDKGREKLANTSNSGNLITKYRFADTEVDYTLVTKYGDIVGPLKIEKNTPIFEASTDSNLTYSFLVESLGNTKPSLTWDGPSIISSSNSSIKLTVKNNNNASIDLNLFYDSNNIKCLNNNNTQIDSGSPFTVGASTTYSIQIQSITNQKGVYTLKISDQSMMMLDSYIDFEVQ